MAVKFAVAEDALDYLTGIAKPNIVLHCLPFRWTSGSRRWIVVAQGKGFPGNISKRDGIDLSQEICVIGNGRWGTVGGKRCSPELEKTVDLLPR